VDKSDCMTNCYSISRWPLKWTKKLHFCLLDCTILNCLIILASCSSKLLHLLFRLTLVRDLIEETGSVPWTWTTRQERQALSTSHLKGHDTKHTLAFEGNRIWCYACYSKTNKNEIQATRMQCGVVYYPRLWGISHTQHFWGPTDTKLEEQSTVMCYNCY
jgi:hypothetical protein